jgi:hypothetical protein
MGDMSDEYAGHGRTGTLSALCTELCTDPCDMGLCIIMLKHEVMAIDEWHDNGLQNLVKVSLCIQIAIDKMQLCLLSVAYACPYHNSTPHHGALCTQHQQTAGPHNTIHVVCGCEAGWRYCQILYHDIGD